MSLSDILPYQSPPASACPEIPRVRDLPTPHANRINTPIKPPGTNCDPRTWHPARQIVKLDVLVQE